MDLQRDRPFPPTVRLAAIAPPAQNEIVVQAHPANAQQLIQQFLQVLSPLSMISNTILQLILFQIKVSSSILSCESSECQNHNHSKCSSNSCLSHSNGSSFSSLSQSSSVCSSTSEDITAKASDTSTTEKRFTRSSLSNSDTNGSLQSLTSMSPSDSLNNSDDTSKTNSTIVTAKITRSTANLKTDSNPVSLLMTNDIIMKIF